MGRDSEMKYYSVPNYRTRRMKFLVKQGGDKLEATGCLQRIQLNDLEGRVATRAAKEEQDKYT